MRLPSKFAVEYEQLLSLGLVVRSDTFQACIDPLLAASGLVPREGVAAPVEPPETPSEADDRLAGDPSDAA